MCTVLLELNSVHDMDDDRSEKTRITSVDAVVDSVYSTKYTTNILRVGK
jgi:hypothetical protein